LGTVENARKELEQETGELVVSKEIICILLRKRKRRN